LSASNSKVVINCRKQPTSSKFLNPPPPALVSRQTFMLIQPSNHVYSARYFGSRKHLTVRWSYTFNRQVTSGLWRKVIDRLQRVFPFRGSWRSEQNTS